MGGKRFWFTPEENQHVVGDATRVTHRNEADVFPALPSIIVDGLGKVGSPHLTMGVYVFHGSSGDQHVEDDATETIHGGSGGFVSGLGGQSVPGDEGAFADEDDEGFHTGEDGGDFIKVKTDCRKQSYRHPPCLPAQTGPT